MKKIVFLLPASADKPVGGVKVVLDYANRLVEDSCDVEVVYAAFSRTMKWDFLHRVVYRLFFLRLVLSGSWKPKWMVVDKRIRQRLVFSLDDYDYDSDSIIVATAIETALYLRDFNISSDNKKYFIQDFEDWNISSEVVYESYRWPMKKIVISRWLKKEVEHCGAKAEFVPNGFDFHKFYLTIPLEKRDKYQIAFMYHIDKRKGIATAFEAFRIVSREYPQVHLAVFSAYDAPEKFPVETTFVRTPNENVFLGLYNFSAIYVGSSATEGWGLTVGEAMQCGCAVACTDNKGYLEMAKDGVTALVSPVGDAEALARNICQLIADDDLRYRIAKQGERFIHEFDIEKSYHKFKKALGL